MKITKSKQIKDLGLKKLYAENGYGGIDCFTVEGDILYLNGDIFDFADTIDEILSEYYYPFYSSIKLI